MEVKLTDNLNMFNKKFGQIFEELLRKKNLTITQFSEHIGISPKTVREWCGKNGRFPNSPEILKKISKYFDISVHELLFGEPDPKNLISSILEKTEIHSGYYKLTVEKIDISEVKVKKGKEK